MPLTDTDRDMLAVERMLWRYSGSKEQAVRDRFGLSMPQFYQRVNGLLDREEALAFDPILVKRLRRRRVARSVIGSRMQKSAAAAG